MSELSSIKMAVLQVLSWQTPGYICSPNSSAFISQGLEDTIAIENALIEMQAEGLVEFYTEEEHQDVVMAERDDNGELVLNEDDTIKPLLSDEGDIQVETIVSVVDTGWIVTDLGRTKVAPG